MQGRPKIAARNRSVNDRSLRVCQKNDYRFHIRTVHRVDQLLSHSRAGSDSRQELLSLVLRPDPSLLILPVRAAIRLRKRMDRPRLPHRIRQAVPDR